jgi:hypothetical protein
MYEKIQMVAGGVLAAVWGLSALSRRFPDVAWLQRFRYQRPQLSEEHRARMRQRANVYAGVEFILLGLALPMLYVAVTLMSFSEITRMAMAIVLAASVVCIALGITAIVRSRRG